MVNRRRTRVRGIGYILLALLLTLSAALSGFGAFQSAVETYADTNLCPYRIAFDADGLTTAYDDLDETSHRVGSFDVSKTYRLRFTEASFSMRNTSGKRITSSKMIRIDGSNVAGGSFNNNGERDAAYFGDTLECRMTDNTPLLEAGYTSLDAASVAFYYLYFTPAAVSEPGFAVLIEITPNGTPTPREELGALIDQVTGANADNWYRSDDRYNGKRFSQNGFWNDLQPVLEATQAVYSDSSRSHEDYQAAAPDLVAAIADLIPSVRINPTSLYETVDRYSRGSYDNPNYWSIQSWMPFAEARKAARTFLDDLFDETGQPTAVNDVANAPRAEALVAELKAAADALERGTYAVLKENSTNAVAGIRLYATLYDPENMEPTHYTTASWDHFVETRTAALAAIEKYDTFFLRMPMKAYRKQVDSFAAFREACHKLVETKETIHVSFSVIDNSSLRNEFSPIKTISEQLTLAPGTTIGQLLQRYDITKLLHSSAEATMVYINGLLYHRADSLSSGNGWYGDYNDLVLKDSDEVVISCAFLPTCLNISELVVPVLPYQVTDQIKFSRLEMLSASNTVKTGVPFDVRVTARHAMPAYMDEFTPLAGAEIYYSQPKADKHDAIKEHAQKPAFLHTDADGRVSVTLYEEGWCLLNAYDMSDVSGSLTNGSPVLLYVEPTDDLEGVKQRLKAELTAVFEDERYPQTYFMSDDWAAIETAYRDGLSRIDEGQTASACHEAQSEAIRSIQAIQKKADQYNVRNLADFREQMALLPEDLSTLDQHAESVIQALISHVDKMTVFQKNHLKQGEWARYNEIIARYEAGLPEAVRHKLRTEFDYSEVPEADRPALEKMVNWLMDHTQSEGYREPLGGNKLADLFSFNQMTTAGYGSVHFDPVTEALGITELVFCGSPEYAAHMHLTESDRLEADDGTWSIQDDSVVLKPVANYVPIQNDMTFYANGTAYEIKDLSVSGLSREAVEVESCQFYDFSEYKGKNLNNEFFMQMDEVLYRFRMPFNDVTFTVKWGPQSGTNEEIQRVRERALSELEAYVGTFREEDYTSDHWQEIQTLYAEGVATIRAASGVPDIETALDETKRAMDQIPQDAVTVYFTLTEDGKFVTGSEGSLMGLKKVRLSYFDLADYGLERYRKLDETGAVIEQPTVLHLYIRMIEQYYLNGETLEVGVTQLEGADKKALTVSGGHGSLYMTNFWGHDENLSYFVNHQYPLMEPGIGSTADWILLHNGDLVELAMYTDWNFYLNANAGFPYFAEKKSAATTDQFTVGVGEELDVVLHRATTDMNGAQGDVIVGGNEVYKTTDLSDDVMEWTYVGETDAKGGLSISFDTPGTYYLGSAYSVGKLGTAVNTPALAVVNVTETGVELTGDDVIQLIDAIGDVTLESKLDIQKARAAYDALSEDQKQKVSNYNQLVEAETRYAILNMEHVISELPDPSEVTLEHQASIEAAKQLFDELTDSQKDELLVGSVNKLNDVLAALNKLLEPPYLLGDANSDGKVNARDASIIRRYLAGIEVDINLQAADFDKNGQVQARDATAILRYLAGY